MAAWLLIIITTLPMLLALGILYYSLNRKIKTIEIKEKEIDVTRKQDDEWYKLYIEEKTNRQTAEASSKELAEKLESTIKENGLLELRNQQLTWYRCTVNHCANRKPPHVYDMDGKEIEAGV